LYARLSAAPGYAGYGVTEPRAAGRNIENNTIIAASRLDLIAFLSSNPATHLGRARD
jgi:hypothetical protein